MIDLKELREATENITSGKALFRYANAEKLKTNFTMATKPSVILELLNRLEAAESKLKKRDLGKAFWHTRYKQKCEADLKEFKKLQDRLEAAEHVCDAAVHYCNPDDDEVCYLDFVEIVKRWQQEVNQCADQQQKK